MFDSQFLFFISYYNKFNIKANCSEFLNTLKIVFIITKLNINSNHLFQVICSSCCAFLESKCGKSSNNSVPALAGSGQENVAGTTLDDDTGTTSENVQGLPPPFGPLGPITTPPVSKWRSMFSKAKNFAEDPKNKELMGKKLI